jgi:hypothetical protein
MGETKMTKMEKKSSRVASVVDQRPLARKTRTIAEHNTEGGSGQQKLSEVYESAQSTKEGGELW